MARATKRLEDVSLVAFDADDTLWHNEPIFLETQRRFRKILKLPDSKNVDERLYAAELKNIRHFGYGIKGFALSMIETAIEMTKGKISGRDIQKIVELAREMTTAPIELLDGARETVQRLAGAFDLMIITKGDLFDQESKIARSGLGDHFKHIEIVSEKHETSYGKILRKHRIEPGRFVMVGNSVKSDILPVLALGAFAVHVPYETEWVHEKSDRRPEGDAFFTIARLAELPSLLRAS